MFVAAPILLSRSSASFRSQTTVFETSFCLASNIGRCKQPEAVVVEADSVRRERDLERDHHDHIDHLDYVLRERERDWEREKARQGATIVNSLLYTLFFTVLY